MAVHTSVSTGLPRGEAIRFNQPDDASGSTPSHKVEGTTSDSVAKQIVADKSGNAVAMKLPA